MTSMQVYEAGKPSSKMQFGIWLPVYGGWLRTTDQPTGPDVAACLAIAQQAEAMGFDFLYASENLLNCIHGPAEGVADAWSILAAIAATTSKIGLCGAIKPGFRSPFLVARMLDTLSKVAERRLAMNIVCGWWKEEFELSGVDWLDHDRRYDRANAFLRDVYRLFRPSRELMAPVSEDAFPAQNRSFGEASPSYGLDERSMPEIWISGHSDRATQMAAEWGHCLFLNGMEDAQLRQQIENLRREENRWGRSITVAVNAYVVAAETTEQAQERLRVIKGNSNIETISFFREVMIKSGAAAWAELNEDQMVDSNAGFELGLVGSFDDIRARLPILSALGVNRIVCQFDDPMRDAGPFMKRVIRPMLDNSKASPIAWSH
jgi:FMNH2-dependent dimethyl sulfone monooxygenase